MTLHATLSAEGQVTIPALLRERLRWAAGTVLDLVETADGLVLRPRDPAEGGRLTLADFHALVPPHDGPPVSLAAMDEAVAALAAGRGRG